MIEIFEICQTKTTAKQTNENDLLLFGPIGIPTYRIQYICMYNMVAIHLYMNSTNILFILDSLRESASD